MYRRLIDLALIVWFRENIKVIFKASVPILIIYFVFTPLYRLWDPKLSELGYGMHLLSLYTLVLVIIYKIQHTQLNDTHKETLKQLFHKKEVFIDPSLPIYNI